MVYLPAIVQGADWSLEFQLLQPYDAIIGGNGSDGAARFDGYTIPTGTTLDENKYSLTRNVTYSSVSISDSSIVDTNIYSLSSQSAISGTGFIGVLTDLTGWTVECQMREFATDTLPIVTPNQAIDLSTGIITLSIPHAATKTLAPMQLRYDIFLTPPGGKREQYLTGNVIVKTAITRLG